MQHLNRETMGRHFQRVFAAYADLQRFVPQLTEEYRRHRMNSSITDMGYVPFTD